MNEEYNGFKICECVFLELQWEGKLTKLKKSYRRVES